MQQVPGKFNILGIIVKSFFVKLSCVIDVKFTVLVSILLKFLNNVTHFFILILLLVKKVFSEPF